MFEKKLRWLNDEEWITYGYDIKKDNEYVELHRKPLKRFEDIDTSKVDGISIHQVNRKDYLVEILSIISEIMKNHSTAKPDDIGIIFMENNNENFSLVSDLSVKVKENYNWETNPAYLTKKEITNTLFISNKNNVKGLEFSFVICIMQNELGFDISMRNSIYMMLTRSFVTSYFVFPKIDDDNIDLKHGIDDINRKGYLRILEPSEDEKKELTKQTIDKNNLHKPLYDIIDEILDQYKISEKEHRKKIHDLVKTMYNSEIDMERLEEFIRLNISMME